MTPLKSLSLMSLACALALGACPEQRAAVAPAPPAPSSVSEAPAAPAVDVVEAPKASPVAAADVIEAPVNSAEQGLPVVCTKLLTCCTEWVKVTPTAQVGCDAQRHAFRAAKTPEDKAKLGDLCEQALAAWAQLTNIPEVCK